jgi:hypothetical protein
MYELEKFEFQVRKIRNSHSKNSKFVFEKFEIRVRKIRY